MDSFYGGPARFPGPFIGNQRGMPGVQAPPHMVVYNHYALVSQLGQVGFSFMGATYIPSRKQPDWKHDRTFSASGRVEDDMNSINMDNHIQELVEKHVCKKWSLIAKHLAGRIGKQCRERWFLGWEATHTDERDGFGFVFGAVDSLLTRTDVGTRWEATHTDETDGFGFVFCAVDSLLARTH
ncbi:hypothetical protein Tco_1333126, partial [Tanacetum coccineum]